MTNLVDNRLLPAFVGARTQALSDLIVEQGCAMLESKGLQTNARAVSIVLTLHKYGPLPLTKLASHLNQPHQLTAQRLSYIEQAKLVQRKPDPKDARRSVLHLTARGRKEAELLLFVLEEASQAFITMFDEIGCDLLTSVNNAIDALQSKPLLVRMSENSPLAQSG